MMRMIIGPLIAIANDCNLYKCSDIDDTSTKLSTPSPYHSSGSSSSIDVPVIIYQFHRLTQKFINR